MSPEPVRDPATLARLLAPLPPRPTLRTRRRTGAHLLVAPLLAFLFVFTILPCLLSIVLAFFSVDILGGTFRFVGLDNLSAAYARGEIARSLVVTGLYILYTVPISLGLGLAAALAIGSLRWAAAFWRAVYFLPVAATLVAMSIVWRWMFVPRRGLVDMTFGRWFGLTDWLNSPSLSLPAVAIVGNWQQIGFIVILYLAGLAVVPGHLLEAARVDGAGAWQRFRHVTWPALGPTTVFAAMISSINALRTFDTVAAMTAGGPSGRSETLAYLMWQRGIYYFDIGGGAVVSLVLLGSALLATAIQKRATATLERAGTR